ncbi:oligoendopeptidase F [Deltaproteobacteria bacterium]|nr:oligoendopeptidase F [Deltaproteobacteria bacterium]
MLTLLAALALPSLLSSALAADPTPRVVDTWDLSAVYPSVEAWEAALAGAGKDIDALQATCTGRLAVELQGCLERSFAAQELVARLNVYAMNLSNEDTANDAWLGRSQSAQMLATKLSEATAAFQPELLSLGGPKLEAEIAANPKLAPFDHYLRATIADAPHTLDAAGEGLLASAGNVLAAPDRLHSVLLNGELVWPELTLSDGSTGTLNPTKYTDWRAAPNRADRKLVFERFFGTLGAYSGTFGGMLDTAVAGHWYVAKARHYDSSVSAAMAVDHLPRGIYDTLVARTNANLPTLHRYLKLRAKMLGVTDLAYSDLYTPLVAMDKQWTIDEAQALTLEATKPLGKDYAAALATGFAGRWEDVYPKKGKVGGAYMDGAAYAVHPFVLLNFTGDYESVSTFAHEWGHAIHSHLSAKKQPYAKADYATFIAEIASTFNEALLMQTMLKHAKTDDEKLFYLGSQLEGLRTTYFRQAQFAEFELAIHQQVERGEPLTGDSLSATYLGIVKRYYGADQGITQIPDVIGNEWAYIPHFYYNFYVYQYATSLAASSLLSQDVLAKKPGALDRYLTLLSAGGSDDPYVLLRTAGVDMATNAPYDALAKGMEGIMDQMEAILAKRAKR